MQPITEIKSIIAAPIDIGTDLSIKIPCLYNNFAMICRLYIFLHTKARGHQLHFHNHKFIVFIGTHTAAASYV